MMLQNCSIKHLLEPLHDAGKNVINMKELHDERLDIHVLSVCSVVCNVQMIEVTKKYLW
jgi:hypothetical protein